MRHSTLLHLMSLVILATVALALAAVTAAGPASLSFESGSPVGVQEALRPRHTLCGRSASLQAATVITLYPIMDTYVDQALPTSNFWSNALLYVARTEFLENRSPSSSSA